MDPRVLRVIVHRAYYEHEALVTGERPGYYKSCLGNLGICLVSTYDAAHALIMTLLFIATYVISVYKFQSGWRHSALTDWRLGADIIVILMAWRLIFDLMTTAAHRPFRHAIRFWFLYILIAGALDVVVEGLWWVARKTMLRKLGVLDLVGDLYARKNAIIDPITSTTVMAYTIGKAVVTTILHILPYIYKLLKCLIWLKRYLSCLELLLLIVIIHSIYIVLNESIASGSFFTINTTPIVTLPPVWSQWFVYIAKVEQQGVGGGTGREDLYGGGYGDHHLHPYTPGAAAAAAAVERDPLMRLTSDTTMASPTSFKKKEKMSEMGDDDGSQRLNSSSPQDQLSLRQNHRIRRNSQPPSAIYQIIPWYKCITRFFSNLILKFCQSSHHTHRLARWLIYKVQRNMDFGSISVSYTILEDERIQILIDRAGDTESVVRLDGVVLTRPILTPSAVTINKYTFAGQSYSRKRGAGVMKLFKRPGHLQTISWAITSAGEHKVAEITSRISSNFIGSDVLLLIGDSEHTLETLCVMAFDIIQFTSLKNIIAITNRWRISDLNFQAAHIITIGDGWYALDQPIPNILMIDARMSAKTVWNSNQGLTIASSESSNFICHSDSNNFKTEYTRVYGIGNPFDCTHSNGRIFHRRGTHVRCNEDGLQYLMADWLKRL